MHNPTRRAKRFRPLHQPPGTNDTLLDPPSGSIYVRHRQAGRPGDSVLRGAMFVALVVVTIVLYIILWELERSSFTSVPRSSAERSVVAVSPSSGSFEGTSKQYPNDAVVIQDSLVISSGQESNLSDDRIVLPSSKPARMTPNVWPPPITRVPEEHDTDDLTRKVVDNTEKNEKVDLSSFDTAYCNGACRFLLPARIGEQESKARVHFSQLLILARRLNRTIVLPNVGKSRMSACSRWPFGTYYDTNDFSPKNDTPDFWLGMDLERFSKWVNDRPAIPSGFIVSMGVRASRTEPKDAPFTVEKVDIDSESLTCLESRLARLCSSLPKMALSVSFHSTSLKTELDTSSRVVELLSDNLNMDTDSDFDFITGLSYEHTLQYINSSYLSLADVDVLVIDYDLRHPLFTIPAYPNFNLRYAPVLYDLADRLVDNLGPFLGVHWRMENVPVQNLAWCAASLVSTLHALLQDDIMGKNIRHVWLATDYPRTLGTFLNDVGFPSNEVRNDEDRSPLQHNGPLRKSSTFKVLSSEHDDALGILTEAFQPGGDLDAWRLTDLAEQLHRYPYVEGRFDLNETLLGDPGVYGILDKLVIVQAKVFVSGSTDCSKTSSFSKHVIDARKVTFEAERGKGAIHNIVEYFGKW